MKQSLYEEIGAHLHGVTMPTMVVFYVSCRRGRARVASRQTAESGLSLAHEKTCVGNVSGPVASTRNCGARAGR